MLDIMHSAVHNESVRMSTGSGIRNEWIANQSYEEKRPLRKQTDVSLQPARLSVNVSIRPIAAEWSGRPCIPKPKRRGTNQPSAQSGRYRLFSARHSFIERITQKEEENL